MVYDDLTDFLDVLRTIIDGTAEPLPDSYRATKETINYIILGDSKLDVRLSMLFASILIVLLTS